MKNEMPSMIFADRDGRIMDFEGMSMVGRSGDYFMPITPDDTIPLPGGSHFYVLPDRYPMGMDRETGEIVVVKKNPYDGKGPVFAVATFLCAAHTQTYIAAWESKTGAKTLPLYAYTALGWSDGFVTTAIRTDASRRQDPEMFNMELVQRRNSRVEKGIPKKQARRAPYPLRLELWLPCSSSTCSREGKRPLCPRRPQCNATLRRMYLIPGRMRHRRLLSSVSHSSPLLKRSPRSPSSISRMSRTLW